MPRGGARGGGGGGRGRKPGHKGGAKHFSNEEEMRRQTQDIQRQKELGLEPGAQDRQTTVEFTKTNEVKQISDSSSDESSSSDDEPKVGAGGIEVHNPNRMKQKTKKLSALTAEVAEPQGLNRKEREEVERQRREANYQRMHAAGQTEEAQRDMARLALIRKQREEARQSQQQDSQAKEEAASKQRQASLAAVASKPQPGGGKKK